MTNKRARGCDIATSLEHRRARGAARSANALRMALKRETHEKRITRMRRNTSDGPRLENPARRAPAAGENETTRKNPSTVLDGVAGRLDAVARAAASFYCSADADAGFLWKASALRLVVETSRALDERDSSQSTRRTTSRFERDFARPLASPIRERKPPSSAALELMTQAFSRDGDGANPKPPPAYYAHAAFVACDALYARKGRRAPKAFVSAAIRSGALAWPSSFARTETSDGPFPVTFVDVASRDGAVSTRSRATSDLPRHNTAATYRHAWLMAFRAGRGPELEAWSSKEGGPEEKNETEVAWPSPRGAGEETSAFRLVRVFLDDDDALWDFMECVLKAAEMEQEEEEEEEEMEEEEEEEEEEGEEEEEEGANVGFSRSVSEASRLDMSGRTDSLGGVFGASGAARLGRRHARGDPPRRRRGDSAGLHRSREAVRARVARARRREAAALLRGVLGGAGRESGPTRKRKRAKPSAGGADPEGFRDALAAFALTRPRRDRRRARTARGVAEWRLAFVGSIIHISNPATRRRATRGDGRVGQTTPTRPFSFSARTRTGVGFGPARRQVSTRSRSEASVSHAPNSGSATSSTNLDQRLASFERTRASRSRSSSARSRVVFCPCPLAPLAPSRSQSPCVP